MSRSPSPLPRLGALCLAATLLTGFGRRNDDEPQPPPRVVEAAILGAKDRGAGIAALEEYLAGRPDEEVAPWAKVWAGEQRRLAGDDKVARKWFERAALDHPTHPVKDAAVLGMAVIDAGGNLSGNTLATLQLMDPESAPDTLRADRLRILARTAANEGTPGKKTREMAERALALADGDPTVRDRVRMILADLLPVASGGGEAPATIDSSGNIIPPEELALQRARKAMADGRHAEVIEQADAVAAAWPDSPAAEQLKWLKKRAEAGDPTMAGRVAVMLPLSGEYGPPAQRIRDAIQLANTQLGGALELVVVDTAGDPAKAVKQVQELVLDKGAVAILGPLHRDVVDATAPVAQGLGVPMVALTQSGDPTAAGDYVFRGFLSIEDQVAALVDHAAEQRGLLRFAVLHPRNSYGETARDLFGSAVAAKGGAVVRIVSYDPEATNFTKAAQELGGKDYVGRAAEFRELKRAAVERRQDPDKVVLPPVIDYDALFVPDNFRRTALVASALAYEEFPIGTFRPSFGGDGVALLGLNGWHNDTVVELGGDYMRGAVFVDAWDEDANDAAVVSFKDAYSGAYGRQPVLLDAVAYDAARLLASAVQAGGDDRDEIREKLLEVGIIGPVTQATGFGDDREIERALYVLEIGENRIAPWQPPEAVLPPEGIAPPPGQ
ncbi:MAG: penicillin-binding protein activator [Alphaproteobacteria bacterium]|nr:penicillin-binding protein activator [Alphaproteobacteria bacterium]